MAGDWPVMSLRDANVTLIDCDHRTPKAQPTGYPYIAIPQLKQGRIAVDDARRISLEDFETWTRKAKPTPNDVVLSRRCNPGETAHVPPGFEFALGQNLVLLRADGKKVLPSFLRWLVRGPEWWQQIAKFINVGAVFDSLKCADVPNFELTVPPLAAQQAIAHMLGTLDDKIELNRRMNETLEGVARAIFKSWFVDFDPVRAKAEGRDPGVPKPIADLFPRAFQKSPLGDIPNTWRVEPLSVHIDAIKGLSYKGSGLSQDGFPLHNLNSVNEGGGYKYEGLKRYNGEYKERHIVHPGDIIVTNTEQGHDLLLIGYPAIVPRRFGDSGLFSHHLFRVRPKPESPVKPHFLYYMLMTPLVRAQLTGHTNGTTVNMLAASGLEMPLFVVPDDSVITAFEAIAKRIWQRIEQTHEENPALEAIRDALLPKLLSGEVRVGDVKRGGQP